MVLLSAGRNLVAMNSVYCEMAKIPAIAGQLLCTFVLSVGMAIFAPAAAASADQAPTPGFAGELTGTQQEVLQALNEVLEDQIVHGTLVFDKDPILTGATSVTSTPLFARWTGAGKVFYKIRPEVIAPRHFRDSEDLGSIAVRYVVMEVDPTRVRIRIDAIFAETARRTVHPSDGTVESSEFKAIQEHLQALQIAAQEVADAKRRRDSSELVRQTSIRQREDESTRLAAAQGSVKDLEQRIRTLRHDVERRVKAPGTELKSAPFHSAAKVQMLAAFTEVVVVIVTPHWYGVETPDGQRGWIALDQLEPLP